MDSFDPTDIAGLEASRQDSRNLKRIAEKQMHDDFKWFLSDPRGRRLLFWLFGITGIWRISFDTNALKMAFAEGGRNIGNVLLSMVHEHCPNRYFEMLKEQKKND